MKKQARKGDMNPVSRMEYEETGNISVFIYIKITVTPGIAKITSYKQLERNTWAFYLFLTFKLG